MSQNSFSRASYKPSRYNITVADKNDGGGVLYNSLTGARVAVSPDVLTEEQLLALEADSWPAGVELPGEDVLAFLKEQQFFVPEDADEAGLVLRNRHDFMHDSNRRRVSVILTRKCNLGCTYCFQDKDVGDERASRELILKYLKSQIVPGGLLQVTWFGGEPTLRLKMICDLSDEVIAECEKNGTSYYATVSTNGVLLNEEKIGLMLSKRVMRYQISLDGPQQVQELRRPSLNGKPTYDIILTNIELLVKHGAEVNIKVILDRDNYESVPTLFKQLGERDLLKSVKVAIQHTEAKFAAREYDRRFASLEEFTKIKLGLLELLVQNGYSLSEPVQRPEFCAATSPFSTMVDMAGKLFRCGTEEVNVTGRLTPDGQDVVLTNVAYEEMFTKRKYAISDCQTCKVLPLCGGGCTVAAEKLAERDVCSFFKVGVKDYLLMLQRQDERLRNPDAGVEREELATITH